MEEMLSYNERIVNMEVSRIDLCDLLLACGALDTSTDENNHKWSKLHDKLEKILNDFDKQQNIF